MPEHWALCPGLSCLGLACPPVPSCTAADSDAPHSLRTRRGHGGDTGRHRWCVLAGGRTSMDGLRPLAFCRIGQLAEQRPNQTELQSNFWALDTPSWVSAALGLGDRFLGPSPKLIAKSPTRWSSTIKSYRMHTSTRNGKAHLAVLCI